MYVSIGRAAIMLGISISTLRAWEKKGNISAQYRTIGGHRRYSVLDIKKKFGLIPPAKERKIILYSRVSSSDQKDDLRRQKERLEKFCGQSAISSYETIEDLGSGLNYKKRGLKKLIRMILSGNVEKIILTHKDRLLRFGAEIIFYLCEFFNTDITIIDAGKNLSDDIRLAHDVIEIITVFSSKLYGKRSHQNRLKAV